MLAVPHFCFLSHQEDTTFEHGVLKRGTKASKQCCSIFWYVHRAPSLLKNVTGCFWQVICYLKDDQARCKRMIPESCVWIHCKSWTQAEFLESDRLKALEQWKKTPVQSADQTSHTFRLGAHHEAFGFRWLPHRSAHGASAGHWSVEFLFDTRPRPSLFNVSGRRDRGEGRRDRRDPREKKKSWKLSKV